MLLAVEYFNIVFQPTIISVSDSIFFCAIANYNNDKQSSSFTSTVRYFLLVIFLVFKFFWFLFCAPSVRISENMLEELFKNMVINLH